MATTAEKQSTNKQKNLEISADGDRGGDAHQLDWHDVSAAGGKTAFLQDPRALYSFRGHLHVFGHLVTCSQGRQKKKCT